MSEDKFQKIEKDIGEIWKAHHQNTKDIAILTTTMNSFIQAQREVKFPCMHGSQLRKEFDEHLEQDKENKRDIKTAVIQIVIAIIISALIAAGSASIGFIFAKNAEAIGNTNE